MKQLLYFSFVIAVFCLTTGDAQAAAPAIDGLIAVPRVFNDFPGSALTITNGNSVNGGAGVSEVDIHDDTFGAGGWANRHDVRLSSDAGTTEYIFDIGDSFTYQAEVTLDAGTLSGKEGGLRLNSSVTGDVLFLVKTDPGGTGEIAGFGGGAPFFSFAGGGDPDGYVAGDTILMGITYVGKVSAGSLSAPAQINYFIDRHDGNGVIHSGFSDFSNTEDGSETFNAGFYGQVPVDTGNPSEFIDANFNDIMYGDAVLSIPEPTSIVLLGLSLTGIVAMRRRQS